MTDFDLYFSEHFGVDAIILEAYGAFDVSVVSDLPLFIDSLALAGQPDEAASVGLTSVRFAEATNSLRTKRELRRVVRTLGPWSTRPGPKELGEALRV